MKFGRKWGWHKYSVHINYQLGFESPKLLNLLAFSHKWIIIPNMCNLKKIVLTVLTLAEKPDFKFFRIPHCHPFWNQGFWDYLYMDNWIMFLVLIAGLCPVFQTYWQGLTCWFLLPPVFSPPEMDHLKIYPVLSHNPMQLKGTFSPAEKLTPSLLSQLSGIISNMSWLGVN